MTALLSILVPELVLTAVACALLLMGCSSKLAVRRLTPTVAMGGLLAGLLWMLSGSIGALPGEPTDALLLDGIARFVRPVSLIIAATMLLLAWPSRPDGSGNAAVEYGADAGEFFGLALLSIAGLLLVSVANDLILLLLALELVSVPTYVMVAISRRRVAGREAALKYFFLGALSVALLLLGFSYLYGATGQINLGEIRRVLAGGGASTAALGSWPMLALVLIMLSLAFKLAAFPLHFYVGDVYEGAATPVTAFLAFVPKAAGLIALIRVLQIVGGRGMAPMHLPEQLTQLLWVLAVATMTIGNVLGLMQSNVKRVLAYSSVAHSGYMLAGLAAVSIVGLPALQGALFYLTAYGLMSAAAFGVLMLLPGRNGESAETFEDIAGQGRERIGLGLAMAVACFGLTGIPLTIGFVGKLALIRPAFGAGMILLGVIIVINAAISAGYYLRIVATMFLRPPPAAGPDTAAIPAGGNFPAALAIAVSVCATLLFGTVPPATDSLLDMADSSIRTAALVSDPAFAPR